MNLGPLYKRTSAGKIQQWSIEVEGNKFRTVSGQTDGKKTTTEWTTCEAKNVGRANATTAEEQAVLEAKAKYQKQLDKHYHEHIKDCDTAKFTKVMLAHKYDQFDGDFVNLWSQPKLDGIRCVVNQNGMWTRNGKQIVSAPHVFEAVKHLFEVNPNLVLDGELYNHDLKEDFNKITSLVKKQKPTEEDLKESKELIQYWVYDMVDSDFAFAERSSRLFHIVEKIGMPLMFTPTHWVRNQEELDTEYANYLHDGFEGQMIRKGGSEYQDKRSKFLLKRKEFLDEEFEILSLNEGNGNYTGLIKSATLTDGKVVFDSGIKGDQDFLKSLMQSPDKWVGKQATVRYQNRTPDGIPRFPVVYALHSTERW